VSAAGPVVTISAAYGALGWEIAPDESAGSTLARLLGGLATAGGLYGAGPVDPGHTPERFQLETERRIREEADAGGAVLLGRAAALVLAGRPGVLHVRLDGPSEARAARAAERRGISVEEAEGHLRETDRAREAYVRHFYGADPRDPAHYHLVLDSTAITPEACVAAICTARAGLSLWFLRICRRRH